MTPVIVVVRVIVRTIVVVILVVVRVIVRVLVRIFLPVVVDFFDNWPSTTRRGVRVSTRMRRSSFPRTPPRRPVASLREPPAEEKRLEKVCREISHVLWTLKNAVEIAVRASKIVLVRLRIVRIVPSRQRIVRSHDLPELSLEILSRWFPTCTTRGLLTSRVG